MGDFYTYNTSGNETLVYSNIYENYTHMNYTYTGYTCDNFFNILPVFHWVIVSIGFPLILVTIYGAYTLINADNTAPVFVINLLISDLIQLCCMVVWNVDRNCDWTMMFYSYNFSLMASIGFMVCISMERYLAIAWPVWYRFRRSIKTPVVVCFVVWALPPACLLPGYLMFEFQVTFIIFGVYLLVPFPVFIFSLGGTLRALSAAQISAEEKRRIVVILVLVLLIYTVLFLPTIILFLVSTYSYLDHLDEVSFVFVNLSPLADVMMYIFMRKGGIEQLWASLRCCKSSTSTAAMTAC